MDEASYTDFVVSRGRHYAENLIEIHTARPDGRCSNLVCGSESHPCAWHRCATQALQKLGPRTNGRTARRHTE